MNDDQAQQQQLDPQGVQFTIRALQDQRNEQADRAAQATAVVQQLQARIEQHVKRDAQLQSQLDDMKNQLELTKSALADVQTRATGMGVVNVAIKSATGANG